LDRGAGRFLFDLIDGSERWGGAAAVAAAAELAGQASPTGRSQQHGQGPATIGAHAPARRRVLRRPGTPSPNASALTKAASASASASTFFGDHPLRFRRRLRSTLRQPYQTHRNDALHLSRETHGFEPGIQ